MNTGAEPCSSCDGRSCPTCRDSLAEAMQLVREQYRIDGIYDSFQGPEDALIQMAKHIRDLEQRQFSLSSALSSIANADRKRTSPVYLINHAREALGMEKLK